MPEPRVDAIIEDAPGGNRFEMDRPLPGEDALSQINNDLDLRRKYLRLKKARETARRLYGRTPPS